MTTTADQLAAFDRALAQVARAMADGLRTRDGADARPRLEALGDELRARRARAESGEGIDRAWIAGVIRDVAAGTGDEELLLVAALGAVARLGR